MNIKIFISGKTTGDAVRDKFSISEQKLRQMGAAPVNPYKLGIPTSLNVTDTQAHRFKAIRYCSAIFMLAGYEKSKIAIAEMDEAQRLGLNIFYEDHDGYEEVFNSVSGP